MLLGHRLLTLRNDLQTPLEPNWPRTYPMIYYELHLLINLKIQHCIVTGGSSGLGLALAVLLTSKGADVSIVARSQEGLNKALKDLEVRYACLPR